MSSDVASQMRLLDSMYKFVQGIIKCACIPLLGSAVQSTLDFLITSSGRAKAEHVLLESCVWQEKASQKQVSQIKYVLRHSITGETSR